MPTQTKPNPTQLAALADDYERALAKARRAEFAHRYALEQAALAWAGMSMDDHHERLEQAQRLELAAWRSDLEVGETAAALVNQGADNTALIAGFVLADYEGWREVVAAQPLPNRLRWLLLVMPLSLVVGLIVLAGDKLLAASILAGVGVSAGVLYAVLAPRAGRRFGEKYPNHVRLRENAKVLCERLGLRDFDSLTDDLLYALKNRYLACYEQFQARRQAEAQRQQAARTAALAEHDARRRGHAARSGTPAAVTAAASSLFDGPDHSLPFEPHGATFDEPHDYTARPFGDINPASGLPMMDYGSFDVGGNSFGSSSDY